MNDFIEKNTSETLSYIQTASDFPHGRFLLRKHFYSRYGFGQNGDAGYGKSELDFLSWVIDRTVLNPTAFPLKPGSLWWRKIHDRYMFYSELAGNLFDKKNNTGIEDVPVKMWIEYFNNPSDQTWYRAHNTSIIQSFIDARPEAKLENSIEQYLMNIVLYRLLYAQSLIEGHTIFGELGTWLADPEKPSVKAIVSLPDFYPKNYPLTEEDRLLLMGKKEGLEDEAAKFFDHTLILPWINQLYAFAAKINETPFLLKFIKDKKPVYPEIDGEE